MDPDKLGNLQEDDEVEEEDEEPSLDGGSLEEGDSMAKSLEQSNAEADQLNGSALAASTADAVDAFGNVIGGVELPPGSPGFESDAGSDPSWSRVASNVSAQEEEEPLVLTDSGADGQPRPGSRGSTVMSGVRGGAST